MPLLRISLVAGLTVLALAGAACTGDAGTAASSTPSVTPSGPTGSASPTATATTPTSPTPSPAPVLEDGKHFVFVKKATPLSLRFDLALFYTGDEANQIAGERGDEVPVPNDVYIVNDNPKLRTLPFAPGAKVFVLDWSKCCDVSVTLSAGDFAAFVAHPTSEYHGDSSPYWIWVDGGQIVKMREQYLP
jgi:hypothetical protein